MQVRRHTRRRPTRCLLAVAGALLAVAPAAQAACLPIHGGRLVIRPIAGNATSRLKWRAKDKTAPAPLTIADPTRGTTRVDILDPSGPIFAVAYGPGAAPAWRAAGDPVERWVYKPKNDPAPIDGIRVIKSKPNLFFIKDRGGPSASIAAPVALPIVARVTDATGACFEATFTSCAHNDARRVVCDADPPACAAGGLPAPVGAERAVLLDAAASTPYPTPNPLRAFAFAQQNFAVGTPDDQLAVIDRTFGAPAELPGPRRVRLEFRDAHWPTFAFDGACEWAGVQAMVESTPRLDLIVAALAAEGDELMLRMSGTPAFLSADCPAAACAGRMRPGGACQCNAPDIAGYSMFPPRDYGPEFQAFWRCVVLHYAALGVRYFEIWNEPDVPDSFRKDPAQGGTELAQFTTMFENIRSVLDTARATEPALAEIASEIRIGGPAMSSYDGGIASASPSLPALLAAVDQAGGRLDFVSFHMYTSDPGKPFVQGGQGAIATVLDWVPDSWEPIELSVNEWQTALGTHACQVDAGGLAPAAGLDASVNCDHRGAGYAVYQLAGFLAAGAAVAPNRVSPYVFELFERNDLAPDDFYETGMGLVTAHGLPKPEAGVMWAGSQFGGAFLGAGQEVLGDRSFGWMAARDAAGTTHVLLGQFDSDADMHSTRTFVATGLSLADLIADCGCAGGGTAQENACLKGVLTTIREAADRNQAVAAACPGAGATETAAVLAALEAADAREPLVGSPVRVALGLDTPACGQTLAVDVFEIGPGTTTTEAFRATYGPPASFGAFNTLFGDDAEWLQLAADLWTLATTPTWSVTATGGTPLAPITVPAYGAVYVRLTPVP